MKSKKSLMFPLTLCAILGGGLMAGLFFAFSVCVMRALAQLPPAKGMVAMQAINTAILNPVFFLVFMGTAAVCLFAAVYSVLHWNHPGVRFLFAGSVLYLAGVLLVTAIFNVPMNDALAALTPESPNAAPVWADYLTRWTAWNHVRTVAATAATVCFALALHQSAAKT